MRWCMCLPSWSATLQDTSEAGRLWSVTQVRVTSSPGLASSPPVRLTELGPTETSSNMFLSESGLINTYRCSEEQNCSTLCQYTPQFPLRSSLIQELCTCRTRLHHPVLCWPPLLHQCSSCWSWSSQWCDRWAVWRCPTPCHRSGPGGDQTSRSLCCSCTCTPSLGTWSCKVWMIRCWSWAVWRGHSSPPLREIIENQIKYEELYNFVSARQEIVYCSSKSVFTLLWWTMISCETSFMIWDVCLPVQTGNEGEDHLPRPHFILQLPTRAKPGSHWNVPDQLLPPPLPLILPFFSEVGGSHSSRTESTSFEIQESIQPNATTLLLRGQYQKSSLLSAKSLSHFVFQKNWERE